jgi:predicted Zn-dependent protease
MAQAASRAGPAGITSGRRRRVLFICGGLVLAAGAVVVVVTVRRSLDRDEGIRLALAGNMAEAEPLLADVLARDPDDAEALRALALGRVAAGKLAEASEPLDRWRAVRPDDPEAHLARVDQAVRLGRQAEAIEPARAVLALRPESDGLREQLTYWLFLTGRTEDADAECGRCRQRRDTAILKLLHAEIALRLGDNARAERLTNELLTAGPRTAGALTLRAVLSLEADQATAAIPLLREALAQGGEGEARARHYLSLALAHSGDEEAAKKLLADEQRQLALAQWQKYGRSESVGYKVAIAEALLATGRADEAVRLAEQVLSQDPNCRSAHKILADYYDGRGQSARAAEHRRKAGQ